jgi:hypothetical protein
MKCVTAWLNNADERCQRAQRRMLQSLLDFDLHPLIVNGTPRPSLTEMLRLARHFSPDRGAFMWVNSDCELLDPPPRPAAGHVIGIHRIEDDGSTCLGVDAYVITCEAWDKYYANDLPSMYCGGTHVDWWLTRLAQKHGIYKSLVGLRHPSHQKSNASAGRDEYGHHNLLHFHAWAERNGISTAPEQ